MTTARCGRDDAHGGHWIGRQSSGAPFCAGNLAIVEARTAYDAALDYARNLGAEHGANAASWAYDGNTPRAWYAAALQGIENGDPAILDNLPAPDLSGQWADSLTGPQLAADAVLAAGVDVAQDANESDEWSSDICDAYETAFSEAAESAIVAACKAALA